MREVDTGMRVTYTVQEVATLLGVNLVTAYEVAKKDGFPAIRISPRRIVVPKAAFHKWLEESAGKELEA